MIASSTAQIAGVIVNVHRANTMIRKAQTSWVVGAVGSVGIYA